MASIVCIYKLYEHTSCLHPIPVVDAAVEVLVAGAVEVTMAAAVEVLVIDAGTPASQNI